jgi:hypothetical protein
MTFLRQAFDIKDLPFFHLLLADSSPTHHPFERYLAQSVTVELLVELVHLSVELPQPMREALLIDFLHLHHFLKFERLDVASTVEIKEIELDVVPVHILRPEFSLHDLLENVVEGIGKFIADKFGDEEEHFSESGHVLEQETEEGSESFDDAEVASFWEQAAGQFEDGVRVETDSLDLAALGGEVDEPIDY